MKPEAAHRKLGCTSCHGAHDFETRRAAVDSCLSCHNDEHSVAYKASPHFRSWREEQAASLCYGRLFELDPELKPLFKTDIKEQGKKLMARITVAVRGLNNLDGLVPAVEDLGRRHVGYGVKDEHYDTVGSALLWTLEKGLGDAFTPEVNDAWAATYSLLAAAMKKAAAQLQGAAAA